MSLFGSSQTERELARALVALTRVLDQTLAQRQAEFDYLRSIGGLATKRDLKEMEQRILMTEAELQAGLDVVTAQQGKIAAEQAKRSDELLATIKALQDQIDNENLKPETVAAFERVKAASQALDDTIPDPPEPS